MWCVGAGTRERAHFLLRLFCPKEIFFYIYVLSQCMIYRINFQNYIPLHVKKHYYIYFCLFLKSSMKAFSTSLSNNLQKVMFPVASQLDLQLCATPVCFLFFFGVPQLYLHTWKIGYSASGRCSVWNVFLVLNEEMWT